MQSNLPPVLPVVGFLYAHEIHKLVLELCDHTAPPRTHIIVNRYIEATLQDVTFLMNDPVDGKASSQKQKLKIIETVQNQSNIVITRVQDAASVDMIASLATVLASRKVYVFVIVETPIAAKFQESLDLFDNKIHNVGRAYVTVFPVASYQTQSYQDITNAVVAYIKHYTPHVQSEFAARTADDTLPLRIIVHRVFPNMSVVVGKVEQGTVKADDAILFPQYPEVPFNVVSMRTHPLNGPVPVATAGMLIGLQLKTSSYSGGTTAYKVSHDFINSNDIAGHHGKPKFPKTSWWVRLEITLASKSLDVMKLNLTGDVRVEGTVCTVVGAMKPLPEKGSHVGEVVVKSKSTPLIVDNRNCVVVWQSTWCIGTVVEKLDRLHMHEAILTKQIPPDFSLSQYLQRMMLTDVTSISNELVEPVANFPLPTALSPVRLLMLMIEAFGDEALTSIFSPEFKPQLVAAASAKGGIGKIMATAAAGLIFAEKHDSLKAFVTQHGVKLEDVMVNLLNSKCPIPIVAKVWEQYKMIVTLDILSAATTHSADMCSWILKQTIDKSLIILSTNPLVTNLMRMNDLPLFDLFLATCKVNAVTSMVSLALSCGAEELVFHLMRGQSNFAMSNADLINVLKSGRKATRILTLYYERNGKFNIDSNILQAVSEGGDVWMFFYLCNNGNMTTTYTLNDLRAYATPKTTLGLWLSAVNLLCRDGLSLSTGGTRIEVKDAYCYWYSVIALGKRFPFLPYELIHECVLFCTSRQ